ncbi:MAG: NrfD/PsrC family molybdoenzyme membrane anchor subunit [Nitriliruptoraceae bacterium]
MTDLLPLLAAATPFTGDGPYVLPNEHVHWGPIVWAYLYLAGLGSGNLIVALLPRLPWAMDSDSLMRLRRIAIITALASFLAIPIAVLASLHQPLRMWRVVLAPTAVSPMSYGSWVLVILIALTTFHLWHMHRPEFAYAAERRSDLLGKLYGFAAAGYDPEAPATKAPSRTMEVIHYVRIVFELALIAYTGFLLSSMISHTVWATPTLGVMFFLLAMATGYAWLAMIGWLTGFLRSEARMLQLLAGSGAVFLAGVMALRVWEMVWGAYLSQSSWAAFAEMQFSYFALSFFGAEALGGLVAIGLLAYASWRNDGRAAWIGGAVSLLVLMVIRWHIVIGGQMVSRTRAGLVPFELEFLGAEGVIATAALLVLTATIIGALLWFLPWRTALHASSVDETQSEELVAAAKSADRRRLLTVAGGLTVGIVGGYATVGDLLMPQFNPRQPGPTGPTADRVVNSICLSCDARCGARAVINSEGRVRNVFGNPFHPASTMNQPIPFETSLDDSLEVNGTLCMKGVSGMQYLYDPYRIRLPLKRTGPRGSGEFKVITWDELLEDVVEGGQLFADIGENREIEGMRAVNDPSTPIDLDAPELGPRSYGLVWNTGRGQTPRTTFVQRFLDAFGSKNYVSHTDLCQMNWYVANYLFTGRYNEDVSVTNQLFGDIVNSEFMLFFGVNLGGGWKPGVNTSAPILANRHADGDGYLVLVDPYVPHGRHYADEWVGIKPATDAAMVLAMMQWIMDNRREDVAYLENTSKAAADADGDPTWSNSTYLVIVEEDHERKGRFVRAGDVGLGGDEFVVRAGGQLATHLEADAGELYVDDTITFEDGTEVAVKSSLQLLRDEAFARSIEEWSEICAVPAADIERLAERFVSHGRKATASCYRGATMHSQGIYAGLAINSLNTLIGNMNWKGGVVKNSSGPSWNSGLYDLSTIEGAPTVEGVHVARIDARSDIAYEDSSEFRRKLEETGDGYPSTRPWYPFTHAGVTTEALGAADSQYPYPVKIWINYYINQRHSVPGGIRFEDTFSDPDKIPLFISVDTTISETSIYADYIVPDVMWLDGQYGFMGQQTGAVTAYGAAIRQPVVEPLTGRTDDGRPMLMENFLIDAAIRLGLPGFGDDAIPGDPEGPHAGQRFPLRKYEDYMVRGIANFAHSVGVDPAPSKELEYVSSFPVAAHRDVMTDEEWERAVAVIARGGYFDPPEAAWDENERHTGGVSLDERAPLQIWHEVLGSTRESQTGRMRWGGPTYREPEDGAGRKLSELDPEYPFTVVTFRLATRTKSRTAYDYWAIETMPENRVEINPQDAAEYGIATGDRVRIASRSGSAEGIAKISQRVRPGVIAGTHHFGHTQQGTSEWTITGGAIDAVAGGRDFHPILHDMTESNVDGDTVKADKRRASAGFNVNDAMRRNDDVLDDMPLVDNAGGATVFLDSRVQLEKV